MQRQDVISSIVKEVGFEESRGPLDEWLEENGFVLPQGSGRRPSDTFSVDMGAVRGV